jgi:hypothetical protein
VLELIATWANRLKEGGKKIVEGKER